MRHLNLFLGLLSLFNWKWSGIIKAFSRITFRNTILDWLLLLYWVSTRMKIFATFKMSSLYWLLYNLNVELDSSQGHLTLNAPSYLLFLTNLEHVTDEITLEKTFKLLTQSTIYLFNHKEFDVRKNFGLYPISFNFKIKLFITKSNVIVHNFGWTKGKRVLKY